MKCKLEGKRKGISNKTWSLPQGSDLSPIYCKIGVSRFICGFLTVCRGESMALSPRFVQESTVI